MKQKVVILSIDGGGIRGIIAATILEYMEQRLQSLQGSSARLAQYVDLVAGTSTGGILTALLLSPGEGSTPRYSAAEALQLYFEEGPKIFDSTTWRQLSTLGGVTDEKYDSAPFDAALRDYFGDSRLSSLLKPCLITAYDIERRRAFFFTSAQARLRASADFYVRDAVRAPSSAPTYFEPAYCYSMDTTAYALIDGGLFANNPALCAYAEARKMDFSQAGKVDAPCAEDMLIISLGTGGKSMAQRKPYLYREYRDAGKLKWIAPIIDIMMSGNAETVDYQLRQIYQTLSADHRDDYHRLEPTIGSASPEMDDARVANMEALRQAGKTYINDNRIALDAVVNKLIAHRSNPALA